MLLTTPLIVTVGLSLTIPLSLVGQIILQGQYASALYWIGASIVVFSFLLVNRESTISDGSTNSDLEESAFVRKPSTPQSTPQVTDTVNEDRSDYDLTIVQAQNRPIVQ
jgi:hypothetical protein